MAGRSGRRGHHQRSEVVVSVQWPVLLLRRRRKSVHHHARGDSWGEVTPSLKQEATAGCGGPSADLVKSPRRGRRSPHSTPGLGGRKGGQGRIPRGDLVQKKTAATVETGSE